MEEQMQASNSSVWGSSQYKSNKCREHKEPERRNIYGRLVAVTATGPIYRGKADLAVVPVSVGLAFTQELAARAINPEARVVSSLANRVGGDTAMTAWANTCGMSSATLIGASPRARLMFLNQVLTYARRQGNVNGIEPILGAAVNAAWPWVDQTTLARMLTITSKYLRKSEFAATASVPILDPNTRTFTLFAPGALAKIDPDEWLDWRVVDRIGLGGGRNGTNDRAGDLLGPRGPKASDLPGPDGTPGDDLGFGDDFGRVIGDLLGPRGPNLGNLPGADGNPRDGDRRDDALKRTVEGLLGSRLPSLAGLDAANGGPRRDRGGNDFEGLIGGLLGPRGPDLGNLGGNGGPYGFGSGLGQGGAALGWDSVDKLGQSMQKIGIGVMALGGALIASGAAVTVASGGIGAPLGGALASGGAEILGIGVGFIAVGFVAEAIASEGVTPTAPAGPTPTGSTPAPKPDEPVSVPVITRPPDPKPEEPKHTDLYPDPDGGGGGGNPTQLPDFDGSGGGNPTTLWDENGGGGNPTTLWDENGGGGNPTTKAEFATTTVLTGRGLLAGVVQVGPATFAF